MKDALISGERIEFRGFGSFNLNDYEGYVGRNPKTGATIQIAAAKVPAFKPGKALKDALN